MIVTQTLVGPYVVSTIIDERFGALNRWAETEVFPVLPGSKLGFDPQRSHISLCTDSWDQKATLLEMVQEAMKQHRKAVRLAKAGKLSEAYNR